MKTGIYKIKNKINDKVYIGQSIDIDRRWKEHVSELNRNVHHNSYLQNSWNKYGEDSFEFKTLKLCGVDDLDDFEIKYIQKYNAYCNSEDSNGYNMTVGGQGVRLPDRSVLFNGEICTLDDVSKMYGDSIGLLQNYLKCVTNMPKKYYDAGFRYKDDLETVYTVRENSMHEKVVCDNKIYDSIMDCSDYYEIGYNTMLSWLDGRRYMPQKFIDLELRYEHIETNIKVKPKIQVRGNYVYCDKKLYRNLKIFSLCSKISYGVLKKWMQRPYTGNETLKDLLAKGLKYVSENEALEMGIYIINHDDLRNMGLSDDILTQGIGHSTKKYKTFKVTDISTSKEYIFDSKKDYVRNSEKIIGVKPAMLATIRKYQALKEPYGNLLFEVLD